MSVLIKSVVFLLHCEFNISNLVTSLSCVLCFSTIGIRAGRFGSGFVEAFLSREKFSTLQDYLLILFGIPKFC